jgi:hypothetical protein
MVAKNAVLFRPGKQDMIIEVDQVRGRDSKALYLALNEIKSKHDYSYLYPPIRLPDLDEEGKQKLDKDGKELQRLETEPEWQLRVMKEILKNYDKEEGESDDDFLARIKRLNLTDHFSTIAYEFTQKVCEIFKREPISEEDFDDIPIERQRVFCYDLLQIARIKDPEGLFFPRNTTAEERALHSSRK